MGTRGTKAHRQTAHGPHADHEKVAGAQGRESQWRSAQDSIANVLVDRVQGLDFIFESPMELWPRGQLCILERSQQQDEEWIGGAITTVRAQSGDHHDSPGEYWQGSGPGGWHRALRGSSGWSWRGRRQKTQVELKYRQCKEVSENISKEKVTQSEHLSALIPVCECLSGDTQQ